MHRLTEIIGYTSDPGIADRLHRLAHAGVVEYLTVDGNDVLRHRFRATTDKGTDCAISLPRDQRLRDGAVLTLEEGRAIVIRTVEEHWLCLRPCDAAAALEIGYFAGNLHWRVKFQGESLLIALEGPVEDYLARLEPFFLDGRAERVDDE